MDAPTRMYAIPAAPRGRKRHRGYWTLDGQGGRMMVRAAASCPTPSLMARALGITYATAYEAGYRLGLWGAGISRSRYQLRLPDKDVRECDFTNAPIAQRYGYKGNTYASVLPHVSRAGPELRK